MTCLSVCLLAGCALLVAGCSGRSSGQMVQVSGLAGVQTAPWVGGAPGGGVALVVPEQPQSLLPLLATTATETQIMSQLFAPVIRYSETLGGYEGILAESWSVQTDGESSRLLVRLRPGLRWSDGTVLTADHVADSYRRFYAPRARHPVTVTAVDGTAVEYRGEGPPDVVLAAAELSPLPIHWIGEEVSVGRWVSGPLSHAIPVSGPFSADPRSDGWTLRLRRNPFYPLFDETGQSLPYLESVVVVKAAADMEAFGDLWRVIPGTPPVISGEADDRATGSGIVATIPAGRIADVNRGIMLPISRAVSNFTFTILRSSGASYSFAISWSASRSSTFLRVAR